ncbi:GlsB/YeaQ/YmgE family stress response membrane protein [Kribbella sp. NPDC026611]|uniref:GlsB/YeaQ/YmgE family stress response membrane protein n=1 Tax=Kribbella sp. NPDC026611 TaxID=3154911 RepID=UPI0034091FA8
MGYWIWMIIVSLIAGIIFGPLARLVLPGKQNISLGWTILGGGIGAFIGGLIAYFLGVKDTSGPDWIQYLIQIVCAAIVIAIISARNSKPRAA